MPTDNPATLNINHFPTKSYAFDYNMWGTIAFYPASVNHGPPDPDQASYEEIRYYLTHAEGGDGPLPACSVSDQYGSCLGQVYIDNGNVFDQQEGFRRNPTENPACNVPGQDGAVIAALDEGAFLHIPGTSSTLANREQGFYGTKTSPLYGTSQCLLIAYTLYPADPLLANYWTNWLATHSYGHNRVPDSNTVAEPWAPSIYNHTTSIPTSALGAFYEDDFGDEVGRTGGYTKSGGMCPPMTNLFNTGTRICGGGFFSHFGALEYSGVDGVSNPVGARKQAADAQAYFFNHVQRADSSPMAWTINGCPSVGGSGYYQSGQQVADTSRFYNSAFMQHFIGCSNEGGLGENLTQVPQDQVNVLVNGVETPIGIFGGWIQANLNTFSQYPPGLESEMLVYAGGDQINKRQVVLGFCMLVYTPGTNNCISWADVDHALPGHVIERPFFAEDFLIPWDPVQTMQAFTGTPTTRCNHAGVDACALGLHGEQDLRVFTNDYSSPVPGQSARAVQAGVWRREFRQVWQGHRIANPVVPATLIGRFAVVLNSGDFPVTTSCAWFTQTYSNVIVPTGGDLMDPAFGLDFSTPFVCGTTQVPAGGALFLWHS